MKNFCLSKNPLKSVKRQATEQMFAQNIPEKVVLHRICLKLLCTNKKKAYIPIFLKDQNNWTDNSQRMAKKKDWWTY